MTVSKITHTDVANYIRLSEVSDEEKIFLTNLLKVAIEFIKSYTGLKDEELDKHEDFYIVVMVLCQDMYDNRTLYVDKGNLNKVVETILGMHCVNLL
jgi:hypothetical protein